MEVQNRSVAQSETPPISWLIGGRSKTGILFTCPSTPTQPVVIFITRNGSLQWVLLCTSLQSKMGAGA